MQISTMGVQLSDTPESPIYTWQQTWKFALLGATWAVLLTAPGVIGVLYYNYKTYSGPIDWQEIGWLVGPTVGGALIAYWRKIKALIKVPDWFHIPPEFQPSLKQVEHTLQVTTPATIDSPKIVETTKESHVEPMVIPPEKIDGN